MLITPSDGRHLIVDVTNQHVVWRRHELFSAALRPSRHAPSTCHDVITHLGHRRRVRSTAVATQLWVASVERGKTAYITETSDVTSRHRGPKRKLTTTHVISMRRSIPRSASYPFHHIVWYRALSLRYAHAMRVLDVRASSSPYKLPLCQISFLSPPPIAEL